MTKELEAFNKVKDICWHNTKLFPDYYKEDLDIIETALKALEIVKKRECLFKGLSETTQEEYDLLKAVLL